MSLKEEDCQAQMNVPKTVLLGRYFSAAQQALAAASFMKSRHFVTLQAFVVFLVSVQLSAGQPQIDEDSFPLDKYTIPRLSGCWLESQCALA